MKSYWQRKREELISKLPTIMDVLDTLALEDELWALNDSLERCMFPNYAQEGLFEPIIFGDGKSRLVPCSISLNKYYRGEIKRYSRCEPSLFRRNKNDDNFVYKSKIFYEKLKFCQLHLLIDTYPLTKIWKEGIYLNAPDGGQIQISLNIDTEALAQHYGIKTDLIDLTIDKFTAAFFAVTEYNNGKYTAYEPKEPDYGLFYIYNDTPWIDDKSPYSRRLSVVGLQPFSRPGEQAGFVYRMNLGENFNRISQKKVKFRHDAAMSHLIFNFQNRSKRLFPYDILEDKVRQICEKNFIFSKDALNYCKRMYYANENDDTIQQYIDKLHINIKNKNTVSFTEVEKKKIIDDWNKHGIKEMNKKLVVRYTYKGPIVIKN